MGSVKDLEIIKHPNENMVGEGVYSFSDDYFIYGWKMPDYIKNKGAACCIVRSYFSEMLHDEDGVTDYLGMKDENGIVLTSDNLKEPVNRVWLNLIRRVYPIATKDGYDYSVFSCIEGNYILPIEIIYKNRVVGSLFRMLETGAINYKDLGLDHMPKEWEKLPDAFCYARKKYGRIGDGYVRWDAAKQMSGLYDNEIEDLKKLADSVNRIITAEMKNIALENVDGKFELAVGHDRELIVIRLNPFDKDCIIYGNPDKRIFYSKEAAKRYYQKTQPEWISAISEEREKGKGWEERVRVRGRTPIKMNPEFLEIIQQMYRFVPNALLGKEIFPDTPSMDEIARAYVKYLGE